MPLADPYQPAYNLPKIRNKRRGSPDAHLPAELAVSTTLPKRTTQQHERRHSASTSETSAGHVQATRRRRNLRSLHRQRKLTACG